MEEGKCCVFTLDTNAAANVNSVRNIYSNTSSQLTSNGTHVNTRSVGTGSVGTRSVGTGSVGARSVSIGSVSVIRRVVACVVSSVESS